LQITAFTWTTDIARSTRLVIMYIHTYILYGVGGASFYLLHTFPRILYTHLLY